MSLLYNRPRTVDEAVALLQQHGSRAVPLAGGTWLTPRLRTDVDIPGSLAGSVDVVVDLANLPLNYVTGDGVPGNGWLRIGATTRLADIMDDPLCQTLASGILAESARRAGPVNTRNTATVGGCIAARGPVLEFTLALDALGAMIVTADGADSQAVLAPLSGRLITEIRVPWVGDDVRGGLARVARTPADQPIVAAAALVDAAGLRVALGGAAADVLVIETGSLAALDDAIAAKLAAAQPFADFRGSVEYRHAMAPIIVHRALEAAGR